MSKPIPPRKPVPEPKKYACVACSDTRLNSRGGVCVPCERAGRIVLAELEASKQLTEADLFS